MSMMTSLRKVPSISLLRVARIKMASMDDKAFKNSDLAQGKRGRNINVVLLCVSVSDGKRIISDQVRWSNIL